MIAEIGVSHKGSMADAIKLINLAKDAGADAVKLQVYRPEEIWKDPQDIEKRQKLQLNLDYCEELILYAHHTTGIHIGASLFSDYGSQLPWDFIKIASRSYPFIPIGDQGKPVIVSCGAYLPAIPAPNTAYLACVSSYPTEKIPWEQFKYLSAIDAHWGYSSHFVTPYSIDSMGAIKLGAKIIEKHVCLDRKTIEIDKSVSLEIDEFRELVEKSRAS